MLIYQLLFQVFSLVLAECQLGKYVIWIVQTVLDNAELHFKGAGFEERLLLGVKVLRIEQTWTLLLDWAGRNVDQFFFRRYARVLELRRREHGLDEFERGWHLLLDAFSLVHTQSLESENVSDIVNIFVNSERNTLTVALWPLLR